MTPATSKGIFQAIRENGGQYTHAALWTVIALARLGRGDEAMELFHMINPIKPRAFAEGVERYKTEPYVIAADVYAHPMHVGRGGWTWYTGSAGWMYQAAIDELLGLRRHGNTISVNPCVPAMWPGYSIRPAARRHALPHHGGQLRSPARRRAPGDARWRQRRSARHSVCR